MSCSKISRRDFSRRVLFGTAAALSLEDRKLLAKPTEPTLAAPATPPGPQGKLPMGKIGDMDISRLILGGNLLGGFAHSRDLMYVSKLLQHYFTPEKILETLELAEQHGINCVNTNPDGAGTVQRYFKERGGKMKWMVQGNPNGGNFEGLKRLVDAGADTIYIQGNEGDKLSRDGNADLIGKAIEFIKTNGLPAGIAGHELRTPMFVEKAGIAPDYYVKTLHNTEYWSTRRPGQDKDIIDNYGVDNYWCKDPDEVIKYMATVKRPWVAYKVMAAGALRPRPAFQYAFDHGADFILAGIFDFQMAEDTQIAREVLAKVKRERPWMA